MKRFIAAAIAAIVIGVTGTVVFAHSGGTNADGCHAGSQPYHCHWSKIPTPKPYVAPAPQPTPSPTPTQIPYLSQYYASIPGGWPASCVYLNDIVEAHLGNDGNVGIYQRVFGNQAEQACRNDHRDDVRGVFAWAFK